MLSIEEIKLLIEKLERVKKEDLQELIDSNLKILKDLAMAVDANNDQVIDRLDKTPEWFKELPFDGEAMESTILDQKIDNLIGVLGWDVQSTETTNTFNKLFEF